MDRESGIGPSSSDVDGGSTAECDLELLKDIDFSPTENYPQLSCDETIARMSREDQLLMAEVCSEYCYHIPSTASGIPVDINGQMILDVSNLTKSAYMEVRSLIAWAKGLSLFNSLPLTDQMVLIKTSFIDHNMLSFCYRSKDCEPGLLKFTDRIVLSAAQSIAIGWGENLIRSVLEFVRKLRELELDAIEFALLRAILLFYPDAADLSNAGVVLDTQRRYLEMLVHYQEIRFSDGLERNSSVLFLLSPLRGLGVKATSRFLQLVLTGGIQIDNLVSDILIGTDFYGSL